MRPAQNQQPATMATAASTADLAERRLVGAAAVADREPGRGHPERHEQDEAAGEADAGLSGPCVLAVAGVLPAVLGEVREPPVDVGAAELVGDQQRLAGGVAGGVGELRAQGGEAAPEVGREEPLPLGGGEGGPQLLGPVGADLEQGLGDGAARPRR